MPVSAPQHRIDVWTTRTDEPGIRDRLPAYRRLLSNDEIRRAERIVHPEAGLLFVVGRALSRTMLSRYAAIQPRDWQLIIDAHGRPELAMRPAHVPDLRFNLSHTNGLVACAVTVGRELGIDVEHIGRPLNFDVPERFFSQQEVEELRSLPKIDQRTVFFDYWTLKEAYIKARGLGLALPLRHFTFVRHPRTIHRSALRRSCRTTRRRGSSNSTGPRPASHGASPYGGRATTCRSTSNTWCSRRLGEPVGDQRSARRLQGEPSGRRSARTDPDDWLIIAGDTGETPAHLDFVLKTLRPRFAQLIWTAGNHELWTPQKRARSSAARRTTSGWSAVPQLRRPHAGRSVCGVGRFRSTHRDRSDIRLVRLLVSSGRRAGGGAQWRGPQRQACGVRMNAC